MAKGGDGDAKTVQVPWVKQQPFLEKGFNAADSLLRQPPEVYTGPGIAPQSGTTTEAINSAISLAKGGLLDFSTSAAAASKDAMTVDVANNDQYKALASDITNRANENLFDRVLPGINTQAAGMGAFGGSDQALLKSRAIEENQESVTSALAALGGEFYKTDVGARSAALSTAPGIMGVLQGPSSVLASAGQAIDTRRQLELDDTINTFNNIQAAPENALDRFIARTRGQIGTTTTTSVPSPSTASKVATGAVGGALAGSGLASALSLSGPWGWIGAAAGGLLGLL